LVDVRRLATAVVQQWPTIAATVALCAGAATIYVLMATRVYTASSLLEMHTRRPRISSEQGAILDQEAKDPAGISDALNTEFSKMQERTVRDRVVDELIRQADTLKLYKTCTRDELTSIIENTVSFERVRGTHLVQVNAEARTPEVAAAVANIASETAVSASKESTKKLSQQAVTWLQEQIDSCQKDLLNNEARVIAFEQQHNMALRRIAQQNSELSITTINKSLVDQQLRAAVLKDTVSALEAARASPENCGVLPSSTPRAETIQQRLKDYTAERVKLDALLMKYTTNHPSFMDQRRRVDVLREELAQEIERATTTAKADLDLATATTLSLLTNKNVAVQETEAKSQELDQFDIDMIPLKRGLEASTVSYKGLLDRLEQARMATDEDTSLLVVYQSATAPKKPSRPMTMLILALSVVLGLGAGFCLALVVHWMRDTVTDLADIESDLAEDALVMIPHVKGRIETTELARMGLQDKFNPITESVATLRATLLSQGRGRDRKGWVILVTSVAPAEGKTSVSCNLAIAMAQTGKRVFLVEGDMRKPRLKDIFPVPAEQLTLMETLLDPCSDDATFARLPVASGAPNLDVAVGYPVQGRSPSEVLETDTFAAFIAWAKSQYDIVIIDSPPVGLISDAMVYSRIADDVLLVCRFNRTRKTWLRHLLRVLHKNDCPLLGIVLNDHSLKNSPFNYYGYGYNYYQTEGRPRRATPARETRATRT
jgi:capsular exopolysaccharide synthesis family protein